MRMNINPCHNCVYRVHLRFFRLKTRGRAAGFGGGLLSEFGLPLSQQVEGLDGGKVFDFGAGEVGQEFLRGVGEEGQLGFVDRGGFVGLAQRAERSRLRRWS